MATACWAGSAPRSSSSACLGRWFP
jgi:hypothetical protein